VEKIKSGGKADFTGREPYRCYWADDVSGRRVRKTVGKLPLVWLFRHDRFHGRNRSDGDGLSVEAGTAPSEKQEISTSQATFSKPDIG